MIYPWEIEVDVAEEVVLQSPSLRRLMLGKAQELVDKSSESTLDRAKRPHDKDSGDPEPA